MYKKNSRPYLIAIHSAKPSEGENTAAKNWKQNGKWDVTETVYFLDRIKDKDLMQAKVIIDIVNAKVVKNGYGEEKTEQEILEYYVRKYDDKVKQSITNWMIKAGIQPTEEQLAMMEFNIHEPGIIGKVLSGEQFPVNRIINKEIKVD